MKKFGLIFALLAALPAYAGFRAYSGSTDLKIFNAVKCSTGVTCTREADKLVVVSSPTISTGTLTISGADAGDASLLLNADRGDDNADKWEILSEASGDALNFLNKTSGSYVSKFKVSTAGATTTAGSATITGGIVASAGQWVNYGRPMNGLTDGTDVTPGATTVYMSQIFVRANATLTGIKLNNAATCATNKWIVALFDSSGAVVANSDLAGTTCSGTDALQTIAFTGTYAAVGPGVYWIGLYSNGAGAHFRALPAAAEGTGKAGSVTGQTFGTAASVTLPTTFTADKGPVAFTY